MSSDDDSDASFVSADEVRSPPPARPLPRTWCTVVGPALVLYSTHQLNLNPYGAHNRSTLGLMYRAMMCQQMLSA